MVEKGRKFMSFYLVCLHYERDCPKRGGFLFTWFCPNYKNILRKRYYQFGQFAGESNLKSSYLICNCCSMQKAIAQCISTSEIKWNENSGSIFDLATFQKNQKSKLSLSANWNLIWNHPIDFSFNIRFLEDFVSLSIC